MGTEQRTPVSTPISRFTPAFSTDLYELTMLDAALCSGVAHHRATFEVFCRRLPAGRRYGVVAGTARFLDLLEQFRFTGAELDYLASTGKLSDEALGVLADWRFGGDIDGYGEGDLFFAGSPVLTVEATFAEAILLETLALSVFNFDSAVASAAARMRHAAGDAFLMEAGSRRVDPGAAVAAARAAYVAGFDGTSNIAAGAAYGVPVLGTTAHAFTLAHDDEATAFTAQVARFGAATTFLVDTYDTAQGVRNAIAATDGKLARIRIDSGDLAGDARRARAILDDAGATAAEIMVSGDLDEHRIAELIASGAPIDGYEAGHKLVTGSGHPTAGFVYKLVAIADRPGDDVPTRPVAKRSVGKASVGGRKVAWRELGPDGRARCEAVVAGYEPPPAAEPPAGRALQRRLVVGGERVDNEPVAAARDRHRAALAELPPEALAIAAGEPALPVDIRTIER